MCWSNMTDLLNRKKNLKIEAHIELNVLGRHIEMNSIQFSISIKALLAFDKKNSKTQVSETK